MITQATRSLQQFSLVVTEFCKKNKKTLMMFSVFVLSYIKLYNNQVNARALIGQSLVGYCAGEPTEKSRVF